jgi:hypothetical protein
MKDILTARREAGTPRGIEYANRLEAMPPDQAADEIYDMFELCADEDLDYEISCDLQLHPKAAKQIAIAIVRKRAAESGNHELARADDEEILQMLREKADRHCEAPLEWGKGSGAGSPAPAREIDDGERREVGPAWLFEPRSPSPTR